MAQMNPGIILAGQQPNILATIDAANKASAFQGQVQHQNALQALLQEQGAGIAQGDQGALNALAQFDPQAALGVQESRLGMDATRLGMDATRQTMARSDEEVAILRKESAQKAREYAAGLDAAEIAQQQEAITNGMKGLGHFYTNGDRAGYNQFAHNHGINPVEYPFEDYPAHAATMEGVLDAFGQFKDGQADADDSEGPNFDGEQKLRKEFDGLNSVSDFSKVNDAFDRVKASTSDPSPAGDLSLIFNYMKMLDPNSVVRESEFATAAASGSYGERLKAAGLKVVSGERLSVEQRADFVAMSKRLFTAQAENYNDQVGKYRELATEYGLEPNRIATAVEASGLSPEEAAKVLKADEGSSPLLPDEIQMLNDAYKN